MINPDDYEQIVFFTGAGMSAESGVPTYRGSGGVWHCQTSSPGRHPSENFFISTYYRFCKFYNIVIIYMK
jgi:NAD-dependent SIR2 family protein deacetylase